MIYCLYNEPTQVYCIKPDGRGHQYTKDYDRYNTFDNLLWSTLSAAGNGLQFTVSGFNLSLTVDKSLLILTSGSAITLKNQGETDNILETELNQFMRFWNLSCNRRPMLRQAYASTQYHKSLHFSLTVRQFMKFFIAYAKGH